MRTADAQATAQVLFVTVDEPQFRFDVILLDPAVWGEQRWEAGTPISISFDIERAHLRTPVMAMARAWAAALSPIELIFTDIGDEQLVTMAAGEERLVLSMSPFE